MTPALQNSVFVIDASAFVFRAYYALAPLSSKGRPSHAVSGFASMVLKILREKKPKACVVVFDSKKPSFRKEIFSDYKANRTEPPPDISGQIKAVHEMCDKAGLPCLQREGIEADDLIASLVKKFRSKHRMAIVSSDKDLAQLVGDNVVIYDSFKEKVLGPTEVKEKFGVFPDRIRDYLSLTGDSSDNIPGLPGVGPKTALQILEAGGSLDSVLKDTSVLPDKLKKKVDENRDVLELSRRLVTLKDDEETLDHLEDMKIPFPPSFSDFLTDWDLQRVIQQFGDLLNEAASSKGFQEAVSSNLQCASSDKDLAYIERAIKKAGKAVIDFETDSFDRHASRAVGFSVAWDETEAWYVPLKHPGANVSGTRLLEALISDQNVRWICHNWKFDSEVMIREGLNPPEQADDTMLEAYLLHSDRRSFSLDNLAQDLLSQKKGDLKSLLGKSENFCDIPLADAARYAAQDAHLTYSLHSLFSKELKENSSLSWLYQKVEMPLARLLGKMERTGIKVDPSTLKKMSAQLHSQLKDVEIKIYDIAGGEFNINSPKQLQTVLFEKLKLKPTKKTKTGFSTDESVLAELAVEHPLPAHLLEYRGLSKLLSTYVDVLPDLVANDGRIHTQYHQAGTATGRLSSSDPNLQNIPIRTDEGRKIRSAFVPEDGFSFMSADYSQVELRLFAHMSEDESMIKAFRAGRDIHAETAKIIFGSSDKEFRSRAKAINFGIIYGISAFGLSQQLKISRKEAAEFIESYFSKFPKIKTFMESLIENARKAKCTESLMGRRRPLPDIDSKNPTLRMFAERVAVNAPVQGTAADIMKSAMVRVDRELQAHKCESRILLQVHDELVLEVKKGEEEEVKRLVVEQMESLKETPLKELSVPLVVDSSFGKSWADL